MYGISARWSCLQNGWKPIDVPYCISVPVITIPKRGVNGQSVGRHTGGYISFSFDITDALQEGSNCIVICAEDPLRQENIPSGKQSREYFSGGCMYTRTTEIGKQFGWKICRIVILIM